MVKLPVLFMTLGTGVKGNEESLAHGLTQPLILYQPVKVVFFGSDESKKIIDLIKKCYQEEKSRDFPDFEFVQIKDIDNFDDCFECIRGKLEEYEHELRDEEIIIDYTSGTKTMTVSAAIVSFLYHKRLNFVKGKRKEGVVIEGTEVNIEQNLYPAYDKLLMDEAIKLFNNYRFSQAIETLDRIVIHEEKEKYRKIFGAYRIWDCFNHEEAFKILEDIRDERLDSNKAFLGRLKNAREMKLRYRMILADLINNSRRRIEEGKYDDSVARLYRAVELITQIKLLDFGIDDIGEGIKIEKLEKVDIRKYLPSVEKDSGKVRMGIRKKFDLLQDLGWKESQNYYRMFQNHLRSRNDSILAHGVTPVSKKDAEEFFETVLKVSLELFEIGDFIRESEFVKL